MLSTKRLVIGIIFLIAVISIGIVVIVMLYGQPVHAPVEVVVPPEFTKEIVGRSVQGRNIEAYTYGKGPKKLLFVGGIHGGYEWNSVVLAHQFMDYFSANPTVLPETVSVTIIPSANPDGVYKVVGKEGRFAATDVPVVDKEVFASGRFNANGIDLNRNFDCNWVPTSTWQSKTVSAGSSPFSEPEALAIKEFVLKNKPEAVIFWHSQANAVYASECNAGVLAETLDIMNTYASAAGYQAIKSFDSYKVTGDAEGWLASINIPAITVELKTHETVEWEQNLAGVKAILKYYNAPAR